LEGCYKEFIELDYNDLEEWIYGWVRQFQIYKIIKIWYNNITENK
jgi:hypothetical protein